MAELGEETRALVPVKVGGGGTLYVAVLDIDGGEVRPGDEARIADRTHRLDQVLDSVAGLAQDAVERLKTSGAGKVAVQFGFELAVESGSLVAVLGKASTKSTMTVTLEWTDAPER